MKNIPLFKVFMSPVAAPSVTQVLNSGYVGQGPKVDEFEKLLSDYLGTPYVNTVNSGTSALHLAFHMVKDDSYRDEILTTPLTCTATNFPILAHGLKIKWVDLDPHTCNVDMTDLRRKVGPNTLAIVVVHWGGYPCDLDELESIRQQCQSLYGFKPHVIEDAAHGFGTMYKGKHLGNHGNLCMYSFQAIKHLTTIDGGCLISPSDQLHRRAKLLRWYGLDRTSSADFRCEQNIEEWGYKFHMNDVSAAVGIENMKEIGWILEKHRSNSKFLREHLSNIPGIVCLEEREGFDSACWIFTVLVERRDDFMRKMKECGIGVSRVHDRNDKHDCVREFRVPLPSTDDVCGRMCCLPCGWWVSEEDRECIVECVQKGW